MNKKSPLKEKTIARERKARKSFSGDTTRLKKLSSEECGEGRMTGKTIHEQHPLELAEATPFHSDYAFCMETRKAGIASI